MSRVLVVVDCNVFLDVARLLGSPFTADAFHEAAITHAPEPFPHPRAEIDSLRFLAACRGGRFGPGRTLEVWTSTHIRDTVAYKARQDVEPAPDTGHRGLGWSEDAAWGFVDALIDDLVARTRGGNLTTVIGAVDNPPLDHEDGTVFGACRHLEGQNPLAEVFCVTRDRGFLRDFRAGRLSGSVQVITPAAMFQALRTARRGIMPPPPRRR